VGVDGDVRSVFGLQAGGGEFAENPLLQIVFG
jgi:hypothetical protein